MSLQSPAPSCSPATMVRTGGDDAAHHRTSWTSSTLMMWGGTMQPSSRAAGGLQRMPPTARAPCSTPHPVSMHTTAATRNQNVPSMPQAGVRGRKEAHSHRSQRQPIPRGQVPCRHPALAPTAGLLPRRHARACLTAVVAGVPGLRELQAQMITYFESGMDNASLAIGGHRRSATAPAPAGNSTTTSPVVCPEVAEVRVPRGKWKV